MFEQYEHDFQAEARDISKSISHASTYSQDPYERLSEYKKVEAKLSEVQDLIKSMEIEVRSQDDPGVKREMTAQLDSHKKTFAALKKDCSEVTPPPPLRATPSSATNTPVLTHAVASIRPSRQTSPTPSWAVTRAHSVMKWWNSEPASSQQTNAYEVRATASGSPWKSLQRRSRLPWRSVMSCFGIEKPSKVPTAR